MERRFVVLALMTLGVAMAGCTSSNGEIDSSQGGLALSGFRDCNFLDHDGSPLPCVDVSTTLRDDREALGGNWICLQQQNGAKASWRLSFEPQVERARLEWEFHEPVAEARPVIGALLSNQGPSPALYTWNTTRPNGMVVIDEWAREETAKVWFVAPSVELEGSVAQAVWHPHWIGGAGKLMHGLHLGDDEYLFSPYHNATDPEPIAADDFASVDVQGADFRFKVRFDWTATSYLWNTSPLQLACNA